MRGFLLASITIFWAVMMGLLVQRDVIPPFLEAREAARGMAYSEALAPVRKGEHARMTIYLGGNPVGKSDTQLRPNSDGSFTIRSRSALSLALGAGAVGGSFETSILSETSVGPDDRLVSFTFEVRGPSGTTLGQARGRVVGGELHLSLDFGGRNETRVVAIDPRFAVMNTFSAGMRLPNLYVGKTWTTRALDVQGLLGGKLAFQTGLARVVRQEELDWHGQATWCYVVEFKWDSMTTTAWVDEAGLVLRQQASGGMTFIRDADEAGDEAAPGRTSQPPSLPASSLPPPSLGTSP